MLTVVSTREKKQMSYEYIYEYLGDGERNEFFKTLYEQSRREEVHLHCSCIQDKSIPLVVSKRKSTYYIKRHDASIEHAPSCKFDGEYVFAEKGWSDRGDGTIRVSLKNRINATVEASNSAMEHSQLGLGEFTHRLMNYCWEIQMKRFMKTPTLKNTLQSFLNSIQYWSERIWFSESDTLASHAGLSKKQADELNAAGKRMFVLLPLVNASSTVSGEMKLLLKAPYMKYPMQVFCEKDSWDHAVSESFESAPCSVVAGFIEPGSNGKLLFKHVCVVGTSLSGVPIKTPNQYAFAKKMDDLGNMFIFSFETFPVFYKYVPDAMVLTPDETTAILFIDEPTGAKGIPKEKLLYLSTLRNVRFSYFPEVGK